MALDELRHAVTDGADGTAHVVAPAEREDALRLRIDHQFWCTTQAGGCGQQLELPAGPVRGPYFRHKRGASPCALLSSGRDVGGAYAHLAYQRELMAWLQGQGYVPTIEHTLDGAGRADLHVVVNGVEHTLEVQLTDLGSTAWRDRDDRYRGAVDQVTWLFGPAADGAASTQRAREGVTLRIGRDVQGVRVGVEVDGVEIDDSWNALPACRMEAGGVWTPSLDQARERLQERRAAEALRRAEEEAERARLEDERRRAQADADTRAQRRADRQLAERMTRPRPTAPPPPRPPVPTLLPPGPRPTEQWRRVHFDMPAWGREHPIWRWLARYPVEQHEAGTYLAYTALHLFGSGPLSMLDNPDLPGGVASAMVVDMADAGWLRLQDGMWRREDSAPRF
ncbi:competence protein CoiA family protein [Cellulomonas shaoxiangyii]|uniref:Competence protein CoiA nuclease-like domain-containing protein n=1 Tax=Cellulomonas shaoxiangyii TaxID=2566013 RepID=A0A4P7SFF4_9CELL|nr:competence protein CoiA family protein [Cellulomonas shaoxiangyii]QCB92630.1 hypothetical protein E5225_02740 [Cellulomonas shaoxiangyii]TGY85438.1 hypothetical protein E5226_06375 [Cellulomonas shaoxiangyii]